MTTQPSENDIAQICAVAGCTREDAVRRLKGNNNDLNAAVNEFFDDPAGEKYKYDESAFASDRDGTVNNAGISFQVQGPDDEGNRAPGYYSTAPSRPPSRSSNRSPFSNIISLAAEHAAADPTIKMTESEKVDPDLERALRESATEAGVPYSPPQQYGVTEGHTMEKYFGPANRTSYNHNEWAMVPGSSFATEILPDPDPEQRMRKPGTPAFLKPLVDDNRLPALLTIFHAIPLLREKLLCRDNILPDYGLNSEWWTGKTIEFTNSVVIVEESDALNEWGKPTKHNYDDYMREFQRLMAFLSDTERAYGSADALTHMVAYTQYPGHNFANDEDKALHAWEVACENIMKHKGAAANLFTVGVQPPDPSNTWGEPEESRLAFAVLDLELPTPDGADSDSETIYDLFDRKIWASSGLTADTTAFLPEVGEVISFRIKGEKSSKMIRVPSVWFPDRYLVENREVVANMRQAKENERGEMGPIDLKIKKLTDFTTPSGQTVKVKDILATCMRCDENKTSYEGQEEYEKAAPKTTLNLPEEFQKIMNNIDKKLESLEQEKDKIRATVREMSKLFTGLGEGDGHQPTHKYTLCGVSVSKYVTYLKKPLEVQLIEFEDENGSQRPRDQWWKIEFSTTGATPVSVTKVTENEVLLSAYRDSTDCLVVYASEKAMAAQSGELPEPLREFVRADNLSFSSEFPVVDEPEEIRVDNMSPRSPKRKFEDTAEGTVMDLTQIRGPPPAYPALVDNFTPPTSPPKGDEAEKNAVYAFPLPPSYNAVVGPDPADVMEYEKRSRNDGRDRPKSSSEKARTVEMQTKANIPSLLHKPSQASEASVSDAMDVDDLASPVAPKGKHP